MAKQEAEKSERRNTIFVDFDHTLFESNRFLDWLSENENGRIGLLNGEIKDLSHFLYNDSIEFLKKFNANHDFVLVTSTLDHYFQQAKVRASKIEEYFNDMIYSSVDKAETISEYIDIRKLSPIYGTHKLYFIDDAADYIRSVKELNPFVACVRIERKGTKNAITSIPSDEPDAVIKKLSEFDEDLIKLLDKKVRGRIVSLVDY